MGTSCISREGENLRKEGGGEGWSRKWGYDPPYQLCSIAKGFPLIKETFNGCYIELDFTEKLTMKPKFEA